MCHHRPLADHTTLDKDKELRRNILLTMLNDALSSMVDFDNDFTIIKKREGFDLMKSLDKVIRLAIRHWQDKGM